MNTRFLLSLSLFGAIATTATAQRHNTDQLDRGLVAVQTSQGVFCSWRIQADEYYDTQYNLYRDGQLVNTQPLSVSNFSDPSGTTSSHYTVRSVVRGVEQADCAAAPVWTNNYLDIAPQHDASLTSTYVPNDACCADVDGDGQLEILLKYDNTDEINALFPKNGHNGEYSLLECLKMDGTVLWWVNCGPNMGDFQNNEQNIVGYDWDGDGRAEVVMRLCEGATVHLADGTTYVIGADGQNGTSWTNYRQPKTPGGVEWFTYYGKEFLFYAEGATGRPYQCIDYPCARLEPGETDLNKAWGDGYGHRSNKHFFGAPYLDGVKPSIFIGRGIYTRHKFVALDVDPATHQLTERWRWTNNQAGSPWYGQGYHNYSIADVDWDGRDEIVWGSMVIDDNGLGLSTTGLGHGDAHHVGDLNPYIHGQEGFFCNEDEPANNYRDLTTSKIYYRMVDTSDAGRAIAGNFSNDFPGSIGWGAHDNPISLVTNGQVDGMVSTGLSMNFRIYWDGDLQEENFDGTSVTKYGRNGVYARMEGAYSNNSTKATPCVQGDIFGDWREEVIERSANNHIRIYTTTEPTPWRNYSLWYDHQYRNAMVWQMCGYNQPPHVSYFLGELEGITMAPPPLTTQGRSLVDDGGTIDASHNGLHVLVSPNADAAVSVAEGAQPWIMTFNVPSWVQGTAPSECTRKDPEIRYQYYNLQVTGAAFGGDTRVVKQGDGALRLPNVTQTYTGATDVWAGSLYFDGTLQNSPLWLNRFAELHSNGGKFMGGIRADYGSVIVPQGTVTTTRLYLGFGAKVCFDLDAAGCLRADELVLEQKDWQAGPEFNAPVFVIQGSSIAPGSYPLIQAGQIQGDLSAVSITGINGLKSRLQNIDGTITLVIDNMRDAEQASWTGAESDVWDLDNAPNFSTSTGSFVSGDALVFGDDAQRFSVNVVGEVSPASITFAADQHDYTLTGPGSITGNLDLTLAGSAAVHINNVNTFSGYTYINNGTLVPATLANRDGAAYGALGGVGNRIVIDGGRLKATSMTTSHPIAVGQNGATIEVPNATLILNGNIYKQNSMARSTLHKAGAGTLQLDCSATYDTLILDGGTFYDFADNHFSGKTVVFNNGTLQYNNSYNGNSSDNVKFIVPEGCTGVLYPDGRCDYTGTLTGAGTLDVHATFVRMYFKGDWSKFSGTINAYQYKSSSYDPSFDFLNTYGIGQATLNITDGVTVHTNGKNFAVGALSGKGSIDNTGSNATAVNTLSIGGKNVDFTYNGTIVGSKVNKVGTGVWTVPNANVLASADQVTVSAGTLKLNSTNATTTMTGNKTVQVQNGATISGRGVVQSLTLLQGSVYRAGVSATATSNVGTIKSLSGITAYPGSDIYLNKTATADYNTKTGSPLFSYIEADGKLILNGTIHFTYKEGSSGWVPADGQSVTLLIAGQGIEGNPTFDMQPLPEGLSWDLSTIMTDGIARVTTTAGIHQVADDCGPFRCQIFDLAGTLVATFVVDSRDEILGQMREQGLQRSVYLVRTGNGQTTRANRVVLK